MGSSGPPKCKTCGIAEWRHVCGGLDHAMKVLGNSSAVERLPVKQNVLGSSPSSSASIPASSSGRTPDFGSGKARSNRAAGATKRASRQQPNTSIPAPVAEQVDAGDLKSPSQASAGSIPAGGTNPLLAGGEALGFKRVLPERAAELIARVAQRIEQRPSKASAEGSSPSASAMFNPDCPACQERRRRNAQAVRLHRERKTI